MGFLVDFYSIFPIGNAGFIVAYGEAFQMVASLTLLPQSTATRYCPDTQYGVLYALPMPLASKF